MLSARTNAWLLAVLMCACELPEPAGPKPTESAIGGSTKPTATKPTATKPTKPTTTKPTGRTRDRPSQPTKPADEPTHETPPAPTGEETGALIGLRAAHDEARASVGAAPLQWSAELGAYAQQWANQLAANNCQLAHRQGSAYGENLYWTSSGATAAQVVAAWTSESASYDAATHTCSGVCGHYTQVVWSATTKLGCGMASCGAQQVWVCNYDPHGNVVGQQPF